MKMIDKVCPEVDGPPPALGGVRTVLPSGSPLMVRLARWLANGDGAHPRSARGARMFVDRSVISRLPMTQIERGLPPHLPQT